MRRVLVLGGGFAGVEAAIQLREKGYDVQLVSERDYLFVYPISIWIPVGEIAFEDACQPLDELAERHGFDLKIAKVVRADPKVKRVYLEGGEELPYDELVVAIGAGKTKPKGVENTLSPCGVPRASITIQERYEALLAQAKEDGERRFSILFGFGGNPKDKSAVRGGPMFEILFNIHNHLKKQGLRDRFDLTFFAPMPEPGKKMGEDAPKKLQAWIEGAGIAWKVGKKITSFDEKGVLLADNSRLDADLTLFIPANSGHPIVKELGLPVSDAGFILVDDNCRVEGVGNVWAAGDVARLLGPSWIAKQGHVAEAMAKIIAHNLDILEGGKSGELHSYKDHLSILCVMDTGNGATLVYRDEKRSMMVPMPVVGHWMKRAWGVYWKKSKAGSIPRIPGM